MAPVEPVVLEATVALVAMVPRVSMVRAQVNPGPEVVLAATVVPADWQESAARPAALEPQPAKMASPATAGTPEMAELAAQVLTERLGLMVRLPANPGPTVKQAAMVAPADWQESAVRPAALEPRLVRMVSAVLAGTPEMAESAAQAPTERLGLMVRLLAIPGLTVKQAATAVRADWQESAVRPAALESRLVRMVSLVTAGMLASVGRVATVPPVRMGRLSL
jgi:hypothetical protein